MIIDDDPQPQTPMFSATTNQLDYWRIVLFALGVFIGYSMKRR